MALSYFDKFNQMKFDTRIDCSYMDKKRSKVIVSIQGDMEVHYSRFFSQAIMNLFTSESDVSAVILDFKDVKYVSSSFIAAMLHMIQQAKANDIELFFSNLLNHMVDVIDSLGMGHFIMDIDMNKKKAVEVSCYNCNRVIKVKKLGSFKCPSCNTRLHVSDKGLVR